MSNMLEEFYKTDWILESSPGKFYSINTLEPVELEDNE
jgi:hypothetical protein